MLCAQGEQSPEALAIAVEDAAGRLPQHPADQLDALLGCLSRAMPALPGRPNFIQEMLGLDVTEVCYSHQCIFFIAKCTKAPP